MCEFRKNKIKDIYKCLNAAQRPTSPLLPHKFPWSDALTFILSSLSLLGKALDLAWGA